MHRSQMLLARSIRRRCADSEGSDASEADRLAARGAIRCWNRRTDHRPGVRKGPGCVTPIEREECVRTLHHWALETAVVDQLTDLKTFA